MHLKKGDVAMDKLNSTIALVGLNRTSPFVLLFFSLAVLLVSACSIEPSETEEPDVKIELGETQDLNISTDPNPAENSGEPDDENEANPDGTIDVTVSYEDQYTYDAAWGMLIDVCRSEGIDDGRCQCLMDLMVNAHGIDAAMYVAMAGHMHDDAAAALRSEIGEERAAGASQLYGHEQDLGCANTSSDRDDEIEGSFGVESAMDAAEAAVAEEAEGEPE